MRLFRSFGLQDKESDVKIPIGPITVSFIRAALNPDGSVGVVKIVDDEKSIHLTYEQALSLAKVITDKLEKR